MTPILIHSAGTIFYNLAPATSAYFSRGGVLFFAVLFGALSAMAEIPALFAQRPIVTRHAKSAMYHPFTEALALTLVDAPIAFVIVGVFCVIMYFLTGLQRTAEQFLCVLSPAPLFVLPVESSRFG
jgi:ATP-binding cassette, subfamily G (WHITE), member 2, SNQ2